MSMEKLVLEIEEIRAISNYAHWIPMVHGYTDEFLKKKYPGWSWNSLIPAFMSRGFVVTDPREGDVKLRQGLYLRAGIERIIISTHMERNGFYYRYKAVRSDDGEGMPNER